jgi:hypothetical protein
MKIIIALIFTSLLSGARTSLGTTALKGILTARNGDAIPGCNVSLKGHAQYSLTQLCGEFDIDVPDNYEGTLSFSCGDYGGPGEILLKKLKDVGDIVVVLSAREKFENGRCERNFKNRKRIKIK